MSSVYDQAAQAFQSGDRLYIDDAALSEFADNGIEIDHAAQDAARDALEDADTPIFLAVMPSSARTGTANDLGEATGQHGTYVVLLSPNGEVDAAIRHHASGRCGPGSRRG